MNSRVLTSTQPSPPEASGRARLPGVLFVDDDPQVRRAFARIMERAHIPVETADSADAGLRLLEAHPEGFGVIATDYFMPGKTGVDLLQAAALCSPWSARILVSGQLAVEPLLNAINQCGVSQVVTKPWKARELERAVRRALDRANLALRNAAMLDELKAQNRQLRQRARHDGVEDLARLRPFCERLALLSEGALEPEARHSFRLAAYARLLAESMGLPRSDVLACELGALVHDVGKVLPEEVGREAMDSETMSLGTDHAESGYQLLAALPGLQAVAAIVRQHHERFDGLGHPRGLEGREIAIGARIFRLVSGFDRLLGARAAADPSEVERAMREVAHDRGTQYDPAVVDVFLEVSAARWAAAHQRL
jgi:putative nucleotidyltransferase with HDIG domain